MLVRHTLIELQKCP
jgi:hypothetical protein